MDKLMNGHCRCLDLVPRHWWWKRGGDEEAKDADSFASAYCCVKHFE